MNGKRDKAEMQACIDMMAEGLAGARRVFLDTCDGEGLALSEGVAVALRDMVAYVRARP